MAKHAKKKSRKGRKHARRASRGSCQGTPIKCTIKEGNGTPVLYCGKMRPIVLKAGRGGKLMPLVKKGKGNTMPKAAKKAMIAAATSPSNEYQSDYG